MVGLCVERSPEMVVGLLGILKAGGAYLPLDPDYPRERLAFMLADAGAPVLVTQQALLERLPCRLRPAARPPHRCGSTPTGRRSRASPTPRRRSTSIPRHPAYVIYTSGSTGTPKGVVVEHREHCQSSCRRSDRSTSAAAPAFELLCSVRIAFDASIAAYSGRCHWCAARTLVVLDDASASRRRLWQHLIAAEGVTHADLARRRCLASLLRCTSSTCSRSI